MLWNQLRSPLQWLLLFAVVTAAASGDWIDACIVLAIVVSSVGIGYAREYRAQLALEELRSRVAVRVRVLRDGAEATIPARDVVPGDVVLLSAGNLVPADAVLLEATDLFVNEAVLTGESFPVEKKPGPTPETGPLNERTSNVYLGTNVRSGSARCRVTRTGSATQFGAIARRLALRAPETEFERGTRRFGYLLIGTALVMVVPGVCDQHAVRAADRRNTALFRRPRSGPEPGSSARNPHGQPRPRRADAGCRWCAGS